MMDPQAVDLTPEEAANVIRSELAAASGAFQAADPEAGVAACACALGLALQLGPGPTEQVLLSILEEAQALSRRREAGALSALGPAIVGLVAQVRESRALPAGTAMNAWASVGEELGALVGQVGLALTMAREGRSGMVALARTRADLLDDVTQGIFGLRGWLESMQLNGT
jgi:hypothetical protein